MAKLKYPIGIQDFREIRTKGYHYLDKTELIHSLLTEGKNYFLSRPRGFGKSLLLSTIKEIYQGSRELFKDLWIADHWDWDKSHPVVHIKFAKSDYQGLGLEQAIFNELDKSAAELGVVLSEATFKERFEELLKIAAKTRGRVVLLIDEYIDYLEAPEQVKANRETLREFYSGLKDADPHLEFLFITGVSKFSNVSIFSDLNHLQDLSIDEQYNNLLGITQQELETHFNTRLHEIATLLKIEFDVFIAQVKNWYNGYNWGGTDKLYNPFSLLSFLEDGQFNNYWSATGTPTFLVERMRSEGRFQWDADDFVALLTLFNFDIKNIELTTILFQTGYLTFSELNIMEGWCKLDYPNQEVKASLEQLLLTAFQH